MKRLKSNLNCLAGQVPVLTEEENRSIVGGIYLSSFEWSALIHYLLDNGTDVNLTGSQFTGIAQAATSCGVVTNSTWVTINGNQYQKKTVSFYGCGDYDEGLGTATVYYDQCGQAVGMKDRYDFNLSGADRDLKAQLETLFGSLLMGSAYNIFYGIHD